MASDVSDADADATRRSAESGQLWFRVFGSMSVDAESDESLGGPKQRMVLALLLTRSGQVVATEDLVAAVWGADAPKSARRSLQVHVSNLRRALGDRATIAHRDGGYTLELLDEHGVDLLRFQRLIDEAVTLDGGNAVAVARILDEALELWCGRPFGDLADEPPLVAETTRLEELRLRAVETRADAHLELGNHQRLVPDLMQETEDHPLRERLWAQLMTALYRADRQGDALRAYEQARTVLAEELGTDPSPDLRAVHLSILEQDDSLRTSAASTSPTDVRERRRNPYKGLRAFHEADAQDFFGRERTISRLVDALAASRFVAVVGPSGVGKSSLVRAGLLPALREGRLPGSQDWAIRTMLPGDDPDRELTRVLRSGPGPATDRLLVVDQFEEVFIHAASDTAARFLRRLREAVTDPESGVRVVVTLRADFYDHPLDDMSTAELVAHHTVAVPVLDAEALEQVIVEPARGVGVEVEPSLVSAVVNDVARQPGALPLLQFAMTELFDRSRGDTLKVDGYGAIGRLEGALAKRAEELLRGIDDDRQELVRQIFLRLVTLSEGGIPTRRRLDREEVSGLGGDTVAADEILEAFGNARLLTFDRDARSGRSTVELAHEALATGWWRLRGWIETAREDLEQHRRLERAAAEWRDAGRDDGYLLTPTRVDEFASWADGAGLALTDSEREYLETSRSRVTAQREEERNRREREERLERRSSRRLRAIAAVSSVAALVAAGLSVFAFQERDRAQDQERSAAARELAAAATAELQNDPERSILLAVEAMRTTLDHDGTVEPRAESALRNAINRSHLVRALPRGGGIALSPGGRLATLDVSGELSVWDTSDHDRILTLRGLQSGVPTQFRGAMVSPEPGDLSFLPGGNELVVTSGAFQGTIRDAETGESLQDLEGRITRPHVSLEGTHIAGTIPRDVDDGGGGAGGLVGVWDPASGHLVQRMDHGPELVFGYALSPDGEQLVTTTLDGSVNAWHVPTGDRLWTVEPAGDRTELTVAFDPSGSRLALGGLDGAITFRSPVDGTLLRTLTGHETPAQGGIAFSTDGSRLVTAGQRDAKVWDLDSGRELVRLVGHASVVRDVAISDDGNTVYTSTQGGETRVWDVSSGAAPYGVLPTLPAPATTWPDFSPDGRSIATAAEDGDVRVFDLDTLEETGTYGTAGDTHMIRYSDDGQKLVTASLAGGGQSPASSRDVLEVWDTDSGDLLRSLGPLPAAGQDLDLSPDADRVVWLGPGSVRSFDLTSGEEVFVHFTEAPLFLRALYSPDGEHVFTGGRSGGVLLDATSGRVAFALDEAEPVYDAVFVDEERLVTGAWGGGGFRLWDARTGEALRRLPGETIQGSVAVSHGRIATAHSDSFTVRDLDTGDLEFQVEVPTQLVRVRISPDGRYLVAIHGAAGLHLHPMGTQAVLDLAASRVTRELTEEECTRFLRTSCPSR